MPIAGGGIIVFCSRFPAACLGGAVAICRLFGGCELPNDPYRNESGEDGESCPVDGNGDEEVGTELPPYQGPPGGRINSNDDEGNPRQDRLYDDDGFPSIDIDYDHNHGQGQPHVHDWTGPAGRRPGRPPNPGEAR